MLNLQDSMKPLMNFKALCFLVLYFVKNADAERSDPFYLPKCCDTEKSALQITNSRASDREHIDLCGIRGTEDVFLPRQLFRKIYYTESSSERIEFPPESNTKPVQVIWYAKDTTGLECDGNYEDFTMEFDDKSLEEGELFSDDGSLVHNGYSFDQSQFCIRSVLENAVAVRTCKEECSVNKPCINRCCSGSTYFDDRTARYGHNLASVRCVVRSHYGKVPTEKEWSPRFYDSIDDINPTTRREHGIQPLIRKRRPHQYNRCRLYYSTFYTWFKLMKNGDLRHKDWTKSWFKVDLKNYCLEPLPRRGNSWEPELKEGPEDLAVWWCYNSSHYRDTIIPYHVIAFTGILFITLEFYIGIAVVYTLRKDKEPVFRWSIVAYSISMAAASCILVYIFTNKLLPLGSEDTYKNISSTTMGLLTILASFFYFYGFSWFTVLCFDLWLTTTFMNPGEKSTKRIYLYTASTFVLLGGILGSGVIKDVVYSQLQPMDVIDPDDGYFMFLMFGSLVTFSCIDIFLLIATACKIWGFHYSSEIKRTQKKTFLLYFKLFLLMRLPWIIVLPSGVYCAYTQYTLIEETTIIIIAVLLLIGIFLNPIYLFSFLILNADTKRYMESNYPRIKRVMDFFDRIGLPLRRCLALCRRCKQNRSSGTAELSH